MKTLADELLDVLPRLVAVRREGAPVEDIVKLLYCSQAQARAAAKALAEEGRAQLVRYAGAKRRHLVPLAFDFVDRRRACAWCGLVFHVPARNRSAQPCCSRSCAAKWAWSKPEVAQARRTGMVRALQEDGRREALVSRNKARSGAQREHLAQLQREAWADPARKARRCAAIQRKWTPERRAREAEKQKALWADPAWAAARKDAMRGVKRAPSERSAKAKRAVWADPEWRATKGAEIIAALARANNGRRFTPEQRAQRSRSARAGWEKRRNRAAAEAQP